MSKKIYAWEDSRKSILTGMKKVNDVVSATFGPKGRNIILDRGNTSPVVTNDWVTVAREIFLEDPIENIWATMIKEAAEKTNREAGDGTTLTTLLTYEIVREWLKHISTGTNPFLLGKALHKTKDAIINGLKKLAKQITTREETEQIANISSQDEEVGKLIADVMEQVGHQWTITVDDGIIPGLYSEVKMGMHIDQGYLSPYFITNQETWEAILENPYILITDKKIARIEEIIPICEKVIAEKSKEIVIIAEHIEEDVLGWLIISKRAWAINVICISAPDYGVYKKETLEDIAVMTWWTVILEALWDKLEDIELTQLGKAEKIIAKKDSTIILNWSGTEKNIQERADMMAIQIKKRDGLEQQKLQTRLARLTGGVWIIRVGAYSKVEMNNKKDKIEDAINSTKSAIEEGIVDGWGIPLLHISISMENQGRSFVIGDVKKIDLAEEHRIALTIMRNALKSPIMRIAENAWYNGWRVMERCREKLEVGFDAKTWTFVNLMEKWIIDPVKVLRVALENSVSTAIMVLTSEAVITENILPIEKR